MTATPLTATPERILLAVTIFIFFCTTLGFIVGYKTGYHNGRVAERKGQDSTH